MSTTVGGIRIVEMPDLGAFTDDSSMVGEHAGSGRFSAASLSGYFSTDLLRQHGFVGGGTGATLASKYPTLAAAQAVYPHAVALTDTLDWAAMQGLYNAAVAAGATQAAFLLPAGTAVINHPVVTGALSVTYCGAGVDVTILKMLSGGTGAIVHGTSSTHAQGHLQIMHLTVLDGNPSGSGSVGVSVYFNSGGAGSAVEPNMAWDTVAIRKWTQPVQVTNLYRGWYCKNITCYGPDNAVQPYAAMKITAPPGAAGCFDYFFTECMMVNYTWGWDFLVQSPLEAMHFRTCLAYNGWGMVRVRNPYKSSGYKSLLWSFTDCDWQGLGFAIDMEACRKVDIRGGFWIANPNTSGLPTPDGDPRRRYFAFRETIDVTTYSMEVDVGPEITDGVSLFYCDASCVRCRFIGNMINSFAALYAVYEWDNIGLANVVGEFDTQWGNWVSGPRVLDASNQQMSQSLARTQYVGDVNTNGMWTLRGHLEAVTAGIDRIIHVTFPTRDGIHPFFLTTSIIVVVALQHNTDYEPTPTVQTTTQTGFTLFCAVPSITVSVNWIAIGQ